MAEAGYGCIFGDCTSQIDHMVTTISTGASVTVCDEHYAPSLIPLLAAELGVDPGDFYSYIEKYIKRENAKAEKALAEAQAAAAAEGSQGQADDAGNQSAAEPKRAKSDDAIATGDEDETVMFP